MKLWLLALVGLFYIGCAAMKMVVENADTLITHQMTKRLPLTSAQKEALSKDVDLFLDRTKPRAQEIIPVIDGLNLTDPEKLPSNYSTLESLYKKISGDFSALMAKYLAKLDSKQQKELFATLDAENEKIQKKSKEDRIEDIEERFEKVLGSINDKQKNLTKEYAEYFHLKAKERLERRKKLHQRFKDIYSKNDPPSEKESLIYKSFLEHQEEALAGNKNLEILKKVIPTLTNQQRIHLKKELQEVKELLKYFNTLDY